MHSSYQYKDGEFHIGDVSIAKIAKSVGTPCYIYSYEFLKDSFLSYKEAFSDMDTLICYSVKANSNLAILKSFSDLGSGFDIVSGGELLRIKRAGGDPGKVVFSGVGKTREEMKAAIEEEFSFLDEDRPLDATLRNMMNLIANKHWDLYDHV